MVVLVLLLHCAGYLQDHEAKFKRFVQGAGQGHVAQPHWTHVCLSLYGWADKREYPAVEYARLVVWGWAVACR